MTQLPIYHTSGQGRTRPDLAIRFASPELEARIGRLLDEAHDHSYHYPIPDPLRPYPFLDLVHSPNRRRRQRKLRPSDGPLTAAQTADINTNAVRTEITPKRRRKPSIATMIKRAEKAGKTVTSVSVEGDKMVLTFGESNPTDANNPWLAEIEKATKR
jgi:hypothetical protein